MATLGLFLDGLMVVLLALTIISVWVLSARLKYVRNSRQEFEGLIRQFDEATKRADTGVKNLQAAAGKAGQDLQDVLSRARNLRDELGIMIESADSLARRLENAAPAKAAAPAAPPLEVGKAEPAGRDLRSKAEMDLLRAMGNTGRKEGGV